MNYLWPGCLSGSRASSGTVRATTAAEIFFRYSKWHRLNQEVEKTTQENKLDKTPNFGCFDASPGSKSARGPVVRIENKKHVEGEWKRGGYCGGKRQSDTSAAAFYNRTRPRQPLLGAHVFNDGMRRLFYGRLVLTLFYANVSVNPDWVEVKGSWDSCSE